MQGPPGMDEAVIRVMMMPRDTNAHGTIFGGVILSYLDQAGALAARRHAPRKFVTVALDKVEFREPVFVGDVLSFFADVVREGNTSITIRIRVYSERFTAPGTLVHVTEANAVFVAVGLDGRPTPIHSS